MRCSEQRCPWGIMGKIPEPGGCTVAFSNLISYGNGAIWKIILRWGFIMQKKIVVYYRHVSKKCEVIKQKSDFFIFFKKKRIGLFW